MSALKFLKIGVFVSSFFMFFSCMDGAEPTEYKSDAKKRKSGSQGAEKFDCGDTNLVGGSDTTNYKPVVLIARPYGSGNIQVCSATIVGDNTIITASHCLSRSNPKNIRFMGGNEAGSDLTAAYNAGISPKEVVHHGTKYLGETVDPNSMDIRNHDVAILIFENSLGLTSVLEFGPSRPNIGDTVEIVGYGSNFFGTLKANHRFRRQKGKNKISDLSGYTMLDLGVTAPKNTTNQNDVLPSLVDSGERYLKTVNL